MTVIQNVEKAIKKCKGIKLIKVNEHHYIILVKDIDRKGNIKAIDDKTLWSMFNWDYSIDYTDEIDFKVEGIEFNVEWQSEDYQ